MGGIFSRVKVWNAGETVTNTDLNDEFNNIIANADASHSEGYSSNLAQMRTTEDPGGVGSENLTQPISEAQEIERLRFVVQRAFGTPQWYASPAATLATLNDALSQAFVLAPSRIISGYQSVNSSQPKFLKALGAGGIRLLATAIPFQVYIDGALYDFTTDITLTGLSSSATTGNTATLADSFSNAQYSRAVKTFNISSAGAEFTANIGRECIFKIFNGTFTEYFMGTVESATKISGLYRGYLFDSSEVPSIPITLTTGHTITILRMTYIFLNSAGFLTATYNPLKYGSTTPGAASIGDFWFDENVSMWKNYNGTAFVQANSILLGVCAQDSTNTVVSRATEFYRQFNDVNDALLDSTTNTTVSMAFRKNGNVSVYGKNLHWEEYAYIFDITANIVPSETEQASTAYYLYLSEIGTPFISALSPLWRKDLKGFYHPYETWRCIGSTYNDVSSNFVTMSQDTMDLTNESRILKNNVDFDCTASAQTYTLPVAYFDIYDKEITIRKTDSTINLLTVTDGTLSYKIGSQNGSVRMRCNGLGWLITNVNIGIPSEVWLDTFTAKGSTSTNILRFTNITKTIGGDITLTQSASLGDSFTVNSTGRYWISLSVRNSSAGQPATGALTLNLTNSQTTLATLASASSPADAFGGGGGVFSLTSGDVIRPYSTDSILTGSASTYFKIVRVS